MAFDGAGVIVDAPMGRVTDAAVTDPTSSASVIAALKGALTLLASGPTGGGGQVDVRKVGGTAVALGQALAASSIPVVLTAAQLTSLTAPVLAAGENHVGAVGGHIVTPSANFTRPSDTTAYASGDLVANSTTAGSVTPLSWTVARVATGSGMIRRVRLKTSSTSVTTADFRIHLYAASPTVTNGDNGAWLSTHSSYLGSLDVSVTKAFSDAAASGGAPTTGSEISFALASGQTIYGLIEARSAYTPTSAEVFTVELEVLQN